MCHENISTAMNGMMRQMDRLAESANRVAQVNTPNEQGAKPVSLVEETVTQIEADAAVRANLNVIRNEDERLAHLIDTLA